MKAMMSEKLRHLLSNPESARELQKQLLAPNVSASSKKGSDTQEYNKHNRHTQPNK